MNTPSFTHLHVHSHYTLLGGTASIPDLVAQATADGVRALALTDTHALYGAVAFARACTKAGLQSILGMTIKLVLPPDLQVPTVAHEHCVLLACGPAGYRSLCRLSSTIQSSPDREQRAAAGIAWDTLKMHRDGLICIAGGRQSALDAALRMGDQGAAMRYMGRLAGLFDERAYLALELHGPTDGKVGHELVKLGDRFGLPVVAVQPIYTLQAADRPRLRLLAAMDRNCHLAEVPATALPDGGEANVDLHWLHPDEMTTRFAAFPAALTATDAIARQCAPALPDGRPIWPVLKLPPDTTPEQALHAQAAAGLQSRYGEKLTPAGEARLAAELAVINHLGYAPLFLMVAEIVDFARRQQIPVSTRGSVANSLVAYCMQITTVDPIQHDLLFERFLHDERANPPDIDLDFCSVRRDEVLDYVRRTYGADKVALVATISTLRPRSALHDTAKAYGLGEEEIQQLIKRLPDRWHPDPRRQVASGLDDWLAQLTADGPDATVNPQLHEIAHAAFGVLGQPHHLSIHPGGLVVTPGPLTDFVPVQWSPKGFLITQFEHGDVEAIGLPKLDLLGIRALTVLADAAKLVRQHYDPTFDLAAIPLDDSATAALLAQGDSVGVFQCESNGARRTLRQLNVRTVQDLAMANAFFKPGPATGGMAASFIRRYRGEESADFLHPTLAPILGPTQGVLIFQEQILRVARAIAGLSWSEADYLRRGMSKFQPQAMAAMRARFISGCQRPAPAGPAFTPEQARTLWEQVQAFAGYGFNQGHATAYADVSYRSAYLKTHWPAAFLAARLANFGGFHHPAIYIAEAVRLGIAVRPPHINQSQRHFTLHYTEEAPHTPVLWMGLGQVRQLRRTAARLIIAQAQTRPFSSVQDLLVRVPLQTKEITYLIQCGALDGLDTSRAAMLASVTGSGAKRSLHQMAFDFAQIDIQPETPAQRLLWERRVLGMPITTHPLATVAYDTQGLTSLAQLPTQAGKTGRVAVARLPGWTGGQGFFVSDGQSYATAIAPQKTNAAKQITAPRSWTPMIITGRWLRDEWGGGWLQVEQVETL